MQHRANLLILRCQSPESCLEPVILHLSFLFLYRETSRGRLDAVQQGNLFFKAIIGNFQVGCQPLILVLERIYPDVAVP